MFIDIKKFGTMSSITIQENQVEDIKKGIVDILSYVAIIQNATQQDNQQYDQRKTNIFRQDVSSSDIVLKKKILFGNAPSLVENYFNVPALIIRKS
jgi:Asp-tRNA(Asn)/Glu-tRNA(Gln) amidotransferase C subunit